MGCLISLLLGPLRFLLNPLVFLVSFFHGIFFKYNKY